MIGKCIDLALFVIITNVDIPAVRDERARLLWYTCVSGIMLAAHEHYKPYDERQAGLMDLAESMALGSPFLTYLCISSLLLFEASMVMSCTWAVLILITNSWFVLCNFVHISSDIAATKQTEVVIVAAAPRDSHGYTCTPPDPEHNE